MNLEQSNAFIAEEEKNNKRKRNVLISMGLCSILLALLITLIIVIKRQDALTLKMFVNGTRIQITSTLFKEVEGKNYINVKEISQLLGYTYTKGEYEKYDENEEACYLSNDYEIVALKSNEKAFTKYAEVTAVEPLIPDFKVTSKSKERRISKI